MTAPTRTVTPRVRKAARLLEIGIYAQIVLATAGMLTGLDIVTFVSGLMLAATSFGFYRCRQWRKKWEEDWSLDERERALHLQARSKALSALRRLFSALNLTVAILLLIDVGVRLSGGKGLALPKVDLGAVFWIFWGVTVGINSLPILFLIAGETADASDEATEAPASLG